MSNLTYEQAMCIWTIGLIVFCVVVVLAGVIINDYDNRPYYKRRRR